MSEPLYLNLDSVSSTNSYAIAHADELSDCTVVCTREQSSGRGQRGNSWEASPGDNITASILLRDLDVHPADQFVISRAISLAIVETLDPLLPGRTVSIKWPNDIYVGDRKICGILIENAITSTSITRCVVGFGLNVNQQEFLSDAPNPVSLSQLTGQRYDLDSLLHSITDRFLAFMDRALSCPNGEDLLDGEYFQRLWRADGKFYHFRDNVVGFDFDGRIDGVALSGHIALTEKITNNHHTYAFKEITFLP